MKNIIKTYLKKIVKLVIESKEEGSLFRARELEKEILERELILLNIGSVNQLLDI